MVHIRTRRSPGQQPPLAACTTSTPVVRPRGVTPPRPHRPVGIGRQVLNELLAAEAPRRFTVAGLVPAGRLAVVPLTHPAPAADPQPIGALLAEAAHVMRSRDAAFEALLTEDQARREEAAYEEWASNTDAELLAECCADIAAAVAARPELRHDHALLMALAPVVAILKGSVA